MKCSLFPRAKEFHEMVLTALASEGKVVTVRGGLFVALIQVCPGCSSLAHKVLRPFCPWFRYQLGRPRIGRNFEAP